MKRYFGVLVACAFVVAGIYFAFKKYSEKTVESARELSVARIRGDYLERLGWLRVNPDDKSYRNEVTDFFRWYFKEVNEHFNRFGGNRNFDDYVQELSERAGKPGKSERLDEKKATYDYVRKTFDQLKSGNYAPYWTGSDHGVRLDIVSAGVLPSGSEDKIHLPVVVWGLPRSERTDDRNIKKVTTDGAFHFSWKIYDDKMKLVAEIPGDGGPDNRIEWPERYVKWFPPGLLLGHYDIDLLPDNAKTAEISFTINARSPQGQEIAANYLWKLDVPAEWKLKAGEKWKNAQESVRPEEEINAKKTAKN